jgi:hypothetical protein
VTTVAKIGLPAVLSVNIGCYELPCWVRLGHSPGDLSPLESPEFAALVSRHEVGGDIAHAVEDWLRDRGLDAVAAGWRALVADGKGDRLRDYAAGIIARRLAGRAG